MAEHKEAVEDRDRRLHDLQDAYERLRVEKDRELKEREAAYAAGAAELEVLYQRKLTASAMQYRKLKEAFNDLVVAAKDDMAEIKTEGKMREQELSKTHEKEKSTLVKEQELLRCVR
jgi:hypothetical protein